MDTILEQGIFSLLCKKAGQKFSQRKIARILNVSPTAISNTLPRLEKKGFVKIKKDKEMNLNLVEFNRGNDKAMNLKRVENIKDLYLSGFVDFISYNTLGCTAILFGSYSTGEDVFDSDIDIAIIGSTKKFNVGKFSKILGKEIRINYYTSLEGLDNYFVLSLCNGIVLFGGMDYEYKPI